jgi:hypothetical protein
MKKKIQTKPKNVKIAYFKKTNKKEKIYNVFNYDMNICYIAKNNNVSAFLKEKKIHDQEKYTSLTNKL